MSEEIKSEEIKPEEISQKSKANAAVAYGFLFVSWLLLFNKKKEVNNPFVRSHIKSSIIIHFLILLNYVIFISL
jgi:uncharacterized membrane protein